MKEVRRLCEAVRLISPQASLSLHGAPDAGEDMWRGVVAVGGVVLVEATGTLDLVIVDLTRKLEKMSQRMIQRLTLPPPPDEES